MRRSRRRSPPLRRTSGVCAAGFIPPTADAAASWASTVTRHNRVAPARKLAITRWLSAEPPSTPPHTHGGAAANRLWGPTPEEFGILLADTTSSSANLAASLLLAVGV